VFQLEAVRDNHREVGKAVVTSRPDGIEEKIETRDGTDYTFDGAVTLRPKASRDSRRKQVFVTSRCRSVEVTKTEIVPEPYQLPQQSVVH